MVNKKKIISFYLLTVIGIGTILFLWSISLNVILSKYSNIGYRYKDDIKLVKTNFSEAGIKFHTFDFFNKTEFFWSKDQDSLAFKILEESIPNPTQMLPMGRHININSLEDKRSILNKFVKENIDIDSCNFYGDNYYIRSSDDSLKANQIIINHFNN